MPLIVDERQMPPSPVASEGGPPDASLGIVPAVAMLVTNEGLNDPRVLRSIRAASRSGYGIHLVCRAPSMGKPPLVMSEAIAVHWVPRPLGWFRLRRLFKRVSRFPKIQSSDAPRPFWIRPWELWVMGGIMWFTIQGVWAGLRVPADIYHVNDLDALPAGVLLSRWNKVPLLYDAHELFYDQLNGTSRQFRAILFELEHRLIRFAHKIVTVNRSIAETLADWHRVSLPTVVMNCPLAVTTARPTPDGTGDFPARKARIIFQGVYMRDRGLEELLLSAAWYDSAELYLRGYGEIEPALRELVRVNGLEGRVRFLPPAHHAHLVESLVGFDVGVVSYRPTTMNNRLCLPNKAFEYLQAGLALAVSALPELTRLVEETGAGVLFDPDRPKDIARAINALTTDAHRLADYKARSRTAGARFTWETQGEPPLVACYQELIGLSLSGRGGRR